MSPPEVRLWVRLRSVRDHGPAFRRQHPIGPYIADFYCEAAKLVIEVDGWVHNTGDHPQRDERRDAYMEAAGYRVLRYETSEVMRDPDGVAQSVFEAAGAPPPSRR